MGDQGAITKMEQTAQAVIDRWDSPNWKDTVHTGVFIWELRQSLEALKAFKDRVLTWQDERSACENHKIPFELFTQPTCKSMTGCGHCEKCVYAKRNPRPPMPLESELVEHLQGGIK